MLIPFFLKRLRYEKTKPWNLVGPPILTQIDKKANFENYQLYYKPKRDAKSETTNP